MTRQHHEQYVEMGASAYEAKQRQREVVALRKKAARLGYQLVQPEPLQAVA